MLAFLKKYFGPIYIMLITAVVVGILICNQEMGLIFDALASLKLGWVCAAADCIVFYLILRTMQLRYYLARKGYKLSWRQAAQVTGAGQFYSAITPSASGGQPMQVLHLHRMNVPVSLSTACICVKFLGFQAGYLLVGGIMILLNGEMLSQQLNGFRWLVALGYVINTGLIAAVLLTIPKLKIVDRVVRWMIGVSQKLRIVKDGESAFEGFQSMMKDYRDALVQLWKKPVDALVMFSFSVIQVIAYMGVVICIYRAFGLMQTSALDLFAVQLMLFIAAAFIPLPGAAGAQESGFCAFFSGFFPEVHLIPAMLCWRFFSYYLLLTLGLVMMILPGKKNSK